MDSSNADDRYTFLEGVDVNVDGRPFVGTALVISRLSYQDEGVYICEGRELSNPESQYVQERTELVLLGMYS